MATTYPLAASTRPGFRRRIQWAPILFLALPLALYFVWIIGPMFATDYIALTNWDGISTAKFVGLSNFDWLFKNDEFWMALGNNIKWLVTFILVPTVMGLGLAMIFNSDFPGSGRLDLGVDLPPHRWVDQFIAAWYWGC